MKRTKKLLILLISVIALMSLMVLAVSAETVYAGSTISVDKPEVGNSEDMVSYNSSLSDTTVAEFKSTNNPLKIRFLKPGTVTLTVKYTRWRPQASRPMTGTCLTKTYTVIEPDKYIDNQKTIKLESGDFVSGEAFPKFTVEDNTYYYISDASFEYDTYTYKYGLNIPANLAGESVRVAVTLQPRAGYYFAWAGSNDGQVHQNNVYTVEYNGKKISESYVVHDKCASKITVYVDVAVKKQEIKEITISDLDAPYHNGPLDRTASVSDNVVLNKVQYTMFNKELDVFLKGDNVAIAVRVNTKDSKSVFSADGRAYWKELDVYSDTTIIISPTEAVYVFDYTVKALDSQILKDFGFTVDKPAVNAVPATTAKTATEKYKVNSVTWSPADEKFHPGVAYTVKIEFALNNDEYFFADDFKRDSRANINGFPAVLSTEVKTQGKFSTTKYYVEYTFKALEEVYVFPFTDCGGHWGYSYIEASHKMGLLNGTTATTYAPNTDLTVAAAVKLAACMNILYNGGDPLEDIAPDPKVWYKPYMEYALAHGIIDTDLSSRQGEKITRSEYVYIFSRALPAEAFKEINTFAVGDIPDVKSCNTKYEQAIYKFYRAGIVIGNDKGQFMPDKTISRAEVATILVRMMDASFRVKNNSIPAQFVRGTGTFCSPTDSIFKKLKGE